VLDEVIFNNIQKRDNKALECLFDKYYEPLYLFARKLVYNSDIANDVVQSVFIKIWEKSSKIHLTHSLKNYLFISVKNECLQYLRSLKIRDKNNRSWALAYIEAMNIDSMDESLDELMAQIRLLIEKLPRQCKTIYKYRAFYGYKYTDIAGLMNTTESVVKVQMHRANKKLKEMFMNNQNVK
jgi:RNA polymerase sigma-70 factor (ECF subfamily)